MSSTWLRYAIMDMTTKLKLFAVLYPVAMCSMTCISRTFFLFRCHKQVRFRILQFQIFTSHQYKFRQQVGIPGLCKWTSLVVTWVSHSAVWSRLLQWCLVSLVCNPDFNDSFETMYIGPAQIWYKAEGFEKRGPIHVRKKHTRGPEYSGSKNERNFGFFNAEKCKMRLEKEQRVGDLKDFQVKYSMSSFQCQSKFPRVFWLHHGLWLCKRAFPCSPWGTITLLPLDCGPMQVYRNPSQTWTWTCAFY